MSFNRTQIRGGIKDGKIEPVIADDSKVTSGQELPSGRAWILLSISFGETRV